MSEMNSQIFEKSILRDEHRVRLKLVPVRLDTVEQVRQDEVEHFHHRREHLDQLRPSEVLLRVEEAGIDRLDSDQQALLLGCKPNEVLFVLTLRLPETEREI